MGERQECMRVPIRLAPFHFMHKIGYWLLYDYGYANDSDHFCNYTFEIVIEIKFETVMSIINHLLSIVSTVMIRQYPLCIE